MKHRRLPYVFAVLLLCSTALGALAWTSMPIANDPLVRLPGTQPGQVTLEAPSRCLNCHSGYNTQVEPGFNWKGSMMAQAARDFVFWACMAVAAQDSIHAVGRPNAVDICERCHFPQGWLEGRSDPTNASAMTAGDYDGIHCDPCHRQFNPHYETTHTGAREGSDWMGYWDEMTSLSTTAASNAYQDDTLQSAGIKLFNGNNFFVNRLPFSTSYTENGAGQYYVAGGNQKRASFADANAKHQVLYSRFHKSKFFCNSCHDVSNPVLANHPQIGTTPGDRTTILKTEQDAAHSYFHVERTFSEFMLSDYGQQGGAVGMGPFDPAVFTTSLPGNKIGKCQDCHMRDVEGYGCDKSGVPFRPTGSKEHPKSGQPLHDLTGGNIWVSYILASTVTGSPNYNAANAALLRQGPAVLTLDLTQGLGVDAPALLAGVDRAKQQLALAARIDNLQYDSSTGAVSLRVQNQTGHKLISGFPEGRRMFVNIRAYRDGALIYEVNPYDAGVGTLKGLPPAYSPNSPAVGPSEAYVDELVYETHPSSTITGEDETFHFALATGRYKDNRIPPKGFRIADAPARICQPVWHGADDPGYFTAAEYQGGYDDSQVTIAKGADSVQATLYYQVTSREYIEFLRDEITGTGRRTLPDTAYIAQTDPFFAKLKAWGSTIWQIWEGNKNLPGAFPYQMAQASINVEPSCAAPVPVLQFLEPGDGQIRVQWSDVHTSDPNVTGYRLYYDQAGKAQLVAEVGRQTSFVDTGLLTGQLQCYKVTSFYNGACESDYSNILCAVAAPPFTVGDAKLLPADSWVYLTDGIVSAGQDLGWGAVFAQAPSRAAGIKILTSEALSLGESVRLTGRVERVNGEWQISDVRVLGSSPAAPPEPLRMANKTFSNDPGGTLDYVGLSSAGLLVTSWGRVTYQSPGSVVYVDDGSESRDALGQRIGIRVQLPAGMALPALNSLVSVTGISRVEQHVLSDYTIVNGQLYPPGTIVYVPSLWVRAPADLTRLD